MEFTNKANQLASTVGGTRFLLPLDLQYHADGGDPTPTDPPSDPTPPVTDPAAPSDPRPSDSPKTFTQEELNSIAAKEARKAQEKLLKSLGVDDFNNAKEGLAKLKEWQESQKTEAQKQQEMLENLQKDTKEKDDQLFNANAKLSALTAGVQAEYLDDVILLAKSQISDDVDMNAAIAKVTEKYPHFKAQQELQEPGEPKPTFTTGQHTKQPQSEMDKWLAAFK